MIRNSLTLAACLVAGCASPDLDRSTSKWHPTGANAANIAAMVANPRDMIRGRGGRGTDARQAAGAIGRVWQGPTQSLPDAAGAAASGAPN
jgi:type IV pilus biogenesis protein CpaD/CtpE